MSVAATEDICFGGDIVAGPIPFREAVQAHGVYACRRRRPSPMLVVVTDAVLYVNDGIVCDAADLEYPADFPVYLTDLPPPDGIIKHRP